MDGACDAIGPAESTGGVAAECGTTQGVVWANLESGSYIQVELYCGNNVFLSCWDDTADGVPCFHTDVVSGGDVSCFWETDGSGDAGCIPGGIIQDQSDAYAAGFSSEASDCIQGQTLQVFALFATDATVSTGCGDDTVAQCYAGTSGACTDMGQATSGAVWCESHRPRGGFTFCLPVVVADTFTG